MRPEWSDLVDLLVEVAVAHLKDAKDLEPCIKKPSSTMPATGAQAAKLAIARVRSKTAPRKKAT